MDYAASSMSAQPTYIFPILKGDEILQILSELDIEMTKDELKEPQRHKERLRQVFLRLLEVCTGKIEEDFVPNDGLMQQRQTLPFTELHEEFSEFAFFTALQDLFEVCGYSHFSWRDLHSPTSKRLRLQLSSIINLAKFREDQLRVYAELDAPRSAIIAQLEAVNKEHLELQAQLLYAEEHAASKSQELQLVMRECQELELEIARNNKVQAAAREEAESLKKQANDLKDQLATAEWALEEATVEEEKLRAHVVSSPDRRRSELIGRRQRLDAIKAECAKLEKEFQECKTKIINVENANKELTTTSNMLKELLEAADELTSCNKRLDDVRHKLAANSKKHAEIVKETEEAERQLHRTEEKIVYQRKQYKLQLDAVQESLDMARSQLLEVEKERREGMARVEAGEAEVKALETAIEREREKTDNEILGMIAEYKLTESAFLERNSKRMAAIGVV